MVRPIALPLALAASLAALPALADEAPAALAVKLLAHRGCVLAPAGGKPGAGGLQPGKAFPLTAITRDVGTVTLDRPLDAGQWTVKYKVNAAIDAAVAPLHGKPARPVAVQDLPVATPDAVAAVADWMRQKGLAAKPEVHRVLRFDQPGLGPVTVVVSWSHALTKTDPKQVHSVVLAMVGQGGKAVEVAARYPGPNKPDSAVNLIAIADVDGSGRPALVTDSVGEQPGALATRIEAGPKAVTVGGCSVGAE